MKNPSSGWSWTHITCLVCTYVAQLGFIVVFLHLSLRKTESLRESKPGHSSTSEKNTTNMKTVVLYYKWMEDLSNVFSFSLHHCDPIASVLIGFLLPVDSSSNILFFSYWYYQKGDLLLPVWPASVECGKTTHYQAVRIWHIFFRNRLHAAVEGRPEWFSGLNKWKTLLSVFFFHFRGWGVFLIKHITFYVFYCCFSPLNFVSTWFYFF